MKNGTTPWAYRKGSAALHRLPASLKLAFLFTLSLLVFIPLWWILPAAALVLLALSLSAGIKPWELLRGSGPLLFMTVAVTLFQALRFYPPPPGEGNFWLPALDPPGLRKGLLFGLRMMVSFAGGALLFAVTTMTELKNSLGRIEGLVSKKKRLSLGISLMLGFIPRFFEVWETAELAWESRGGRKGPARILALVPLVTERMMEAAAETATALESRGSLL